jgi:hypothetical protein
MSRDSRSSAVSDAIRLLGGVAVAVTPTGEFVLYKPNVADKPCPPAPTVELALLHMVAARGVALGAADFEVVEICDGLEAEANP